MPLPTAPFHADPAALEARLRAVQPACRVVPERHYRRVVRLLAEDGRGPRAAQPDEPLWVDRAWLAAADAVPAAVTAGEAPRVLLVVDPGDRLPESRPDADVLRDSWRMLFRAAVADECREADGTFFEALGPAAAWEARYVLEADHRVPPDAPDADLFRAFAAEVADRVRFAPHTFPDFFPSLPAGPAVLAAVAEAGRFDPDALLARTRPPGAAPALAPEGPDDAEDSDDPASDSIPDDEPAELARRAAAASAKGNHVRAAVLRMRAARGQSGADRDRAEAAARSTLHDGLVARLGRVLGWDYATAKAWSKAVLPLLGPAAVGAWPRAARALYDLQRIAADGEREQFAVDPVEWACTLGRRPLRRSLANARPVFLRRHLASADYHLDRVRLPAADREPLHALIREQMHRTEADIRRGFGPVLHRVLDEVGLVPTNLPERVARDKLVSELLDRVCEKGYLRLSDLRDAVARNQLKMPDLRGPGELARGDPLLRADARLAEELDGVYHRGELYLRLIQRLNAVAFATAAGRWLTRYVALPFGGALMVVEFAKYLAHEFHKLSKLFRAVAPAPPPESTDRWWNDFPDTDPDPDFVGPPPPPDLGDALRDLAPVPTPESALHAAEHEVSLGPESLTAVLVIGLIFLGLLHSPPFRAAFLAGLLAAWRGVRFVAADVPLAAWRSPPVVAFRRHRLTRLVTRYVGAGLVAAGLTAGASAALGFGPRAVARDAGLVFVLTSLALNTRPGRAVEERVSEWASDTWRTVRVNLVPGLIAWTLWAFRGLAGAVERGLYAVDEWLRFREGQSDGSLAAKAVLAAVWFPVAYLVRFGFYLLLEPQINPVKHFPVVTVSHKLLLPLIPSAADATGLSIETVTLLIAGIPGVFGFIAWELKENWRLYAANRPSHAPPAALGHHGETMRGLLRPGFHSGTVPKQFRRLRDAARDADRTGRPAHGARFLHELEETAAVLARTADRELIPLLLAARAWAGLTPAVGPVRVGVQAVELPLEVAQFPGPPLRVLFEHRDGRITARVADPGWAARLTPEQTAVFGVALGGLAELCAATWAPGTGDAVPALSAWLVPRAWPDRVAFWDRAAGSNHTHR